MSRVLMKCGEVEKLFKCGPGGSPCKADSLSGGLWGGFVFIFVPETHHCDKQGQSVSVKGLTERVPSTCIARQPLPAAGAEHSLHKQEVKFDSGHRHSYTNSFYFLSHLTATQVTAGRPRLHSRAAPGWHCSLGRDAWVSWP